MIKKPSTLITDGLRSYYDTFDKIIASAMQLYFSGESLRNVQKFLRLQGVNVSHMGVYKWIRKYVGLMQNYLEKIQPMYQIHGEQTSYGLRGFENGSIICEYYLPCLYVDQTALCHSLSTFDASSSPFLSDP
jgi:hypothetical protein